LFSWALFFSEVSRSTTAAVPTENLARLTRKGRTEMNDYTNPCVESL
jgi:hypothetical protein